MAEAEVLNELLNQLQNQDELDGKFSVSGLIQKISSVISITSKLIHQLATIIKTCTKGDQLAARVDQLAEVTTTLVNLTQLISKISESNRNLQSS